MSEELAKAFDRSSAQVEESLPVRRFNGRWPRLEAALRDCLEPGKALSPSNPGMTFRVIQQRLYRRDEVLMTMIGSIGDEEFEQLLVQIRGAEQVKGPSSATCLVCETLVKEAHYHVHDDLWRSTGWAPDDGVCHVRCLEKKLGRPITLSDFSRDTACNSLLFLGAELARRTTDE